PDEIVARPISGFRGASRREAVTCLARCIGAFRLTAGVAQRLVRRSGDDRLGREGRKTSWSSCSREREGPIDARLRSGTGLDDPAVTTKPGSQGACVVVVGGAS